MQLLRSTNKVMIPDDQQYDTCNKEEGNKI